MTGKRSSSTAVTNPGRARSPAGRRSSRSRERQVGIRLDRGEAAARPGRRRPPRTSACAWPLRRASAVVAMHVMTAGSGDSGSCGYSSRSRGARVRGQRPELAVRDGLVVDQQHLGVGARRRRGRGRAAPACAARRRAAVARASTVGANGLSPGVDRRPSANGLTAGCRGARRERVDRRRPAARTGCATLAWRRAAAAPRARTGALPSSRDPRPPSSRRSGGRSAGPRRAGSGRTCRRQRRRRCG